MLSISVLPLFIIAFQGLLDARIGPGITRSLLHLSLPWANADTRHVLVDCDARAGWIRQLSRRPVLTHSTVAGYQAWYRHTGSCRCRLVSN